MVLDCQLESRQVVVAFFVQQVDVVFVVEDHLKFSGAACLVEEVLGELLALLGQFLILRLELILNLWKSWRDVCEKIDAQGRNVRVRKEDVHNKIIYIVYSGIL